MKTKIDCSFIEKVLFNFYIDELSENERSQIRNHIKSCKNCRLSEMILNYFKQSLQVELTENQIVPNPAILESLKDKLKTLKDKQRPVLDYIKGFFGLRIPVYQVVTALIIIGAFSFILNNRNQNIDSFTNDVSIIASIDSNKISMSFKNSMELIDSYKKGNSIVKDSVLSNFIQSAM